MERFCVENDIHKVYDMHNAGTLPPLCGLIGTRDIIDVSVVNLHHNDGAVINEDTSGSPIADMVTAENRGNDGRDNAG